MRTVKKILPQFISWRVLTLLPIFLGVFLLSYRSGYGYTNIFDTEALTFSKAIYSLANFDGVRYLAIALRGYVTEGAFFPLFPLIIKLLSFWSSNVTVLFWVGLLFSNLCFLAALVFLYKLLRLDYSKKISEETIFLILVFPVVFFYGAVYSESLFLLLLVLTFYFVRQKSWGFASLAAFLLTLTRLVGIFIFPVLLYEYFVVSKNKLVSKSTLQLLAVPLGFFFYSLYNFFKWKDALYFIHSHGQLANSRSVDKIILFPQTMYRYLKMLTSLPFTQHEWVIALFELLVFVFALVLLFKAWRDKVRMSYLIFCFFAFFLPASSGTFSGLPRYMAVLFPLFISLGLTRSKIVKSIYVLVSIVLQFIFLMLFSRGWYVS